MKFFSIAFIVFTLALLGFSTYQGLFVAPTEQTMGDVQRIFYYHVPSAWVAGSVLLRQLPRVDCLLVEAKPER